MGRCFTEQSYGYPMGILMSPLGSTIFRAVKSSIMALSMGCPSKEITSSVCWRRKALHRLASRKSRDRESILVESNSVKSSSQNR